MAVYREGFAKLWGEQLEYRLWHVGFHACHICVSCRVFNFCYLLPDGGCRTEKQRSFRIFKIFCVLAIVQNQVMIGTALPSDCERPDRASAFSECFDIFYAQDVVGGIENAVAGVS